MIYLAEISYAHTQDDLDLIDVDAETRAEAEEVARIQFKRSTWGQLHDVTVLSVTVHEIERRYTLNLASDAADLEVEEVRQ